ncbi:MAG: transglutaminase-like domain-containing protein [Kiritimatiellae bacterium]|nr:transglutaminase-like domain-containing protein [Kiritimatiellia bacterium]
MTEKIAYATEVVICLLALGCMYAGAAEFVTNPKVLTDRSVDTSSLESIVAGIVRPGMTEHEKFLACYDFYRRMIFHHRYMGSDRREVLRAINSYGCLLCGSQAATFYMLLQAAGIPARIVHVKAPSYGSHTVIEAQYDGSWHAADPMTAFYVFNRQGRIASFEELKTDPSLLRDAVKEGRVPPEYCFCGREVESEQSGIEAHLHEDGPWTILRWKGEGTSITDFWQKAVSDYKTAEGPYGGHVIPGVLDFTLKPNEEYVRLWGNLGLWLKKPSFAAFGPFHTCGHADELDIRHFKYFEPYKRTDLPYTRCCYRYYGNGWLEWKPNPARSELEEFASETTNLRRSSGGGPLKVVVSDKPARLVVPVKSPYAVVKVEMDLLVEQPAGAQTRVTLLDRERNGAVVARVFEEKGACSGIRTITWTNDAIPLYLYDLKIEATGGNLALDLLRLKTVFQLNWASLPSLYPGENIVTVSAANPLKLKDHRLLVTYEWEDGVGWKNPQSNTKTISDLPCTYKLFADVPTDKMPRMKRLVIKLERY